MKLTLLDLAHHRNGISGAPFTVALFRDRGPDGSRKLAILFDEARHCAVLDVDRLAAGDIAFGSNSWRGDAFEPALRRAIEQQTHRNTQKPPGQPPSAQPRVPLAVVSVRGGLVDEVRTNAPLRVLVEDWDTTDVRPAREELVPTPLTAADKAYLTASGTTSSEQGA